MSSIEWLCYRWLLVVPNHLKPPGCLMHRCIWWSQRLQIWYTGWMCKSQPMNDKLSLKWAWSRQVIHF